MRPVLSVLWPISWANVRRQRELVWAASSAPVSLPKATLFLPPPLQNGSDKPLLGKAFSGVQAKSLSGGLGSWEAANRVLSSVIRASPSRSPLVSTPLKLISSGDQGA